MTPKWRRATALGSAAAIVIFVVARPAHGQGESRVPTQTFIQQQRSINQELADERTRLAPLNQTLDFQWGGWLDYYIFHFDDGIQGSRLYQQPGLSLWSRLSADGGAHQFFVRMRLQYNYFKRGDEYDRQQDWEGPNFDRAFYDIDLARALHAPAGTRVNANIRVGRQEVAFGTGFALDLPLDAVLLDARLYDFRVQGLFGNTIGSLPNIDRSPPVDSHSNRNLFGVQLLYEGFEQHELFAYALWNQDHTDERPQELLQAYSYDTEYFGVGSRGQAVRNLNYWIEGVAEAGRGYGDGNFRRRDVVEAYAGNVGAEYLFGGTMRPRVSAEYMFASGDSDRLLSPTNAQGGNYGDRRDTSFVGFGYRDTGIAAAPALSNIHVWRAGGSLAPLAAVELFRDFELGTNWFLYHKNQTRGAISDTTAQQFHGYVGWEMDYYLNWRFASDLSWTVRWGVFFPGSAYQDREPRNFVFSGVTWSF